MDRRYENDRPPERVIHPPHPSTVPPPLSRRDPKTAPPQPTQWNVVFQLHDEVMGPRAGSGPPPVLFVDHQRSVTVRRPDLEALPRRANFLFEEGTHPALLSYDPRVGVDFKQDLNTRECRRE
jgi:hypothetical protein